MKQWRPQFGMKLNKRAWYTVFLAKWKEAENHLIADPEINRPFEGNLRKCRFDVFPYALVYRIEDADNLQVIAVMHLSREPGYWRNR